MAVALQIVIVAFLFLLLLACVAAFFALRSGRKKK